jgi:hypothetical protein
MRVEPALVVLRLAVATIVRAAPLESSYLLVLMVVLMVPMVLVVAESVVRGLHLPSIPCIFHLIRVRKRVLRVRDAETLSRPGVIAASSLPGLMH